jgi:hypothetical protein
VEKLCLDVWMYGASAISLRRVGSQYMYRLNHDASRSLARECSFSGARSHNHTQHSNYSNTITSNTQPEHRHNTKHRLVLRPHGARPCRTGIRAR